MDEVYDDSDLISRKLWTLPVAITNLQKNQIAECGMTLMTNDCFLLLWQ